MARILNISTHKNLLIKTKRMNIKYESKLIKLDELVLDKNNPRFAELYSGSEKESDIIEYLLFTESSKEIAEAISKAQEFYVDRPLWVIKDGDKYIVKDGNRRCSAVKALTLPNKYELDLPRFEINELPVLEYFNQTDLDIRIRLEHNSNLFKKWGRIAKALEIYRLFSSGNSIESLSEIDSKPKDFIKIATFYHKASEIKGEDFKKLVREGKGETGGKTIVFERLFRGKKDCGYSFKNTGEILIKNQDLFKCYIIALVEYLLENPKTSSRTLDEIFKRGESFLELLKPFGFPPQLKQNIVPINVNNSENGSTHNENNNSSVNNNNSSQNINTSGSGNITAGSTNPNPAPKNDNNQNISSNSGSKTSGTTTTRHSVKNRPTIKRKKIPAPLIKLIDECFNLDQNNFANSKTALTRVTFECVLKYVVENSFQSNGKPISVSNHFQCAFRDKHNVELPYTNFTKLKIKFCELIKETSYKKAFEVFDLELSHQIIHNYRVGAIPKQAKDLCDNLIELLEFMLQEESDLINSIDISKL